MIFLSIPGNVTRLLVPKIASLLNTLTLWKSLSPTQVDQGRTWRSLCWPRRFQVSHVHTLQRSLTRCRIRTPVRTAKITDGVGTSGRMEIVAEVSDEHFSVWHISFAFRPSFYLTGVFLCLHLSGVTHTYKIAFCKEIHVQNRDLCKANRVNDLKHPLWVCDEFVSINFWKTFDKKKKIWKGSFEAFNGWHFHPVVFF